MSETTEDIHKKLVTFLAQEFSRTQGRQCTRCELVYARKPGVSGDSIRTWNRDGEEASMFDGLGSIEQISGTMLQLAESYARDLPGMSGKKCRFEVRTKQHLGGRERTSFSLMFEEDNDIDEEGESSTDKPTAEGLVSQLMRHNEFHTRTTAAVFQSSLGTMSRMITDLSDENRNLRKERNAHLRVMEEALNEQNDRDLKAGMQIESDKRKGAAFEKIMGMMPIVVNRLLGDGKGAGAGGKADGLAMLASSLADGLQPDQVAKIFGALKPEQQAILMELIKTAKDATAQAAGAPGPGDPGQALQKPGA